MALSLFSGIPVSDYQGAVAWYERLLGKPPAFFPDETEAVWELADDRFLYIDVRPEHAGHAMVTMIVDDLQDRIDKIAARGIQTATDETYDNGTRKVTYLDPEGNEIGFGQPPDDAEATD